MLLIGTSPILSESIFLWKLSPETPTLAILKQQQTNVQHLEFSSTPNTDDLTVFVFALTDNPEHSAGRDAVQCRVGRARVGPAIIVTDISYHQMILVYGESVNRTHVQQLEDDSLPSRQESLRT